MLRLRHALREYFPAALEAFDDLAAADTLELLARAPDPASAARLTTAQISAALKRARRRDIAAKAGRIEAALRAEHLGQPAVVTAAYAATVRAQVAILGTLNDQVKTLEGQVEAYFGQHPDAEISPPSPAWARSSAPGCSPSSATTPAATPPPRPARTTPAPARSPAPPARRRSSWPATCTTTGSSTPSWPGLRRASRLTRRPRLLRPPTRPRHRPQRRPAPARQPPRRHPARLPQDRHPLRRGHRLAAPRGED